MQYRARPVVVDAVQFVVTAESFNAIVAMGVDWRPGASASEFYVATRGGLGHVTRGSWVVQDICGGFRVYTNADFVLTFAPYNHGLEVGHTGTFLYDGEPTACTIIGIQGSVLEIRYVWPLTGTIVEPAYIRIEDFTRC